MSPGTPHLQVPVLVLVLVLVLGADGNLVPPPLRAMDAVDPSRPRWVQGTTPFAATDPRRVLDRDDVDAVVIATPNLLGPWLQTDPATGRLTGVGDADAPVLAEARRLARGRHREPYGIPA